MPGPIPKDPESRVRRNAPTIATNVLPAAGREGPLPPLPGTVRLSQAGSRWWRWAWTTPQSAAWNDGFHYTVCRRAMLEDDLDCIRRIDSGSFDEVLGDTEEDTRRQIEWVVATLRSIAGSEISLMREMRELDAHLGLTPKGMAALRWSLSRSEDEEGEQPAPSVSERRARMKVV